MAVGCQIDDPPGYVERGLHGALRCWLWLAEKINLDREHQSGDRQLLLQVLSQRQNDLVVRAARLKGPQFSPELAKQLQRVLLGLRSIGGGVEMDDVEVWLHRQSLRNELAL
ncbi:hypothetical protein XH98_37370 [Bradyrhizobium sp. CCBAU 51745]|nr:hypothetical protein [Bradyrhizobium sp. CCBAU 51745]